MRKKRGRKKDRGGGKSLRKLKNKVTQMPGQWEVRGLAECGKSQSSQSPQAQSVPTAATPRAAVVTPREGSSGLLTCQRLASVLYNPPKDTLPPGTRSLRAPGPLSLKHLPLALGNDFSVGGPGRREEHWTMILGPISAFTYQTTSCVCPPHPALQVLHLWKGLGLPIQLRILIQ